MTVAQVIEQWQGRPFEWATTDCCQFVGACIEAVTGRNMAELVDYDSETDARALISEAGGLAAVVSSVLGEPLERAPGNDDVVLVNDGTQDIVGFVWQERIVLRTPKGLSDWPLERAEVAWAV